MFNQHQFQCFVKISYAALSPHHVYTMYECYQLPFVSPALQTCSNWGKDVLKLYWCSVLLIFLVTFLLLFVKLSMNLPNHCF